MYVLLLLLLLLLLPLPLPVVTCCGLALLPAPLWHSPSRFETAPIDRSSSTQKGTAARKKKVEKRRPLHFCIAVPKTRPPLARLFAQSENPFCDREERRRASIPWPFAENARDTPSRVQPVPCQGGALDSSTTQTATAATLTLTFVL
ncbi:hypothetical protein TRIATDRAFT_271789 [Trichoderma atroviride IMI 206040]|uniref:Secreted protein n=1 Tax=Hypocrea atroviridis (strain ATCC 20476 / IMI 206040) TaxID=452589 RepID=G9NLW8_HYPAI|nr:uncharacterized protein TRIATDRAFT_271789 [Trichoderma atroviride IMI 206040]EHK47903.1 hypothetical protein TRIATDRAFT_271789 [Trichoderma atroviride IMI 206040]